MVCLATVAAAAAEPCREQTYKGSAYIVCSFDTGKDDIRTFWRGSDGKPFRTFANLSRALTADGKSLLFAMNGGMYEDDLSPVGLYIEEGRLLAPANTKTVSGAAGPVPNFYKKPNGIFYLGGGKAGIAETKRFLSDKRKVEFATQSGPMLVIDGAINRIFIPGSTDRKPRNGVCVASPTRVIFAISQGLVNFYDFASLFRDRLHCKNALFLDGGQASGIYAPELGRNDYPGHGGYGPIIAVVK